MSGLDKKKSFKKNRQKRAVRFSNRIHILMKKDAPIQREVDKRFKTVFVGAVSKIEDAFGVLWGGDEIDDENMTKEQEMWYDVFLALRDSIFDQGNHQKNQCSLEINKILQDRDIQ